MKILVYTTVFPNPAQPTLGIFVRERMFRVAKHCEIKVVAPVPWFPFINLIKKGYRPIVPYQEIQDGVEVFHPKFFNIPKFFKWLDGFFLLLSSFLTVYQLKKKFNFDVIDAHFAYPSGFAAILIGKVLKKPVSITIRGNERVYIQKKIIRLQITYALCHALQLISVSNEHKERIGSVTGVRDKIVVVGNGVDLCKFFPVSQKDARRQLALPDNTKIIISVGWLNIGKGFHHIIRALPSLLNTIPALRLIIVGGAPATDSYEKELRRLIDELALGDHVLLVGMQPHEKLRVWLSAADIFCLATAAEGWANVFLEAMACGLPVVTPRVGGNPEVVCSDDFGILIDLEDEKGLIEALETALSRKWDRGAIQRYAKENTWDKRAAILKHMFTKMISQNHRNFQGKITGSKYP